MKILVMSLGTRGDVEPMLAVAEILGKKGHEVTCAFSNRFKSAVEDAGIPFVSLGTEFMNVLDSKAAQRAFGGGNNRFTTIFSHLKLAKRFKSIEQSTILHQYNAVNDVQPDLILHNGIAVYPFIWHLAHPHQTILFSAAPYYLHYVRDHPFIIFKRNFGPFFNKLTYKMAIHGTVIAIQKARKHIGIVNKVSNRKIKQAILSIKTIYAVSNSLFSKPEYWDEHVGVLGFFERKKITEYKPTSELEMILSKHEKILLISMGSMVNPEPEKITKFFVDALEKHGIPAIIVCASGGFVRPPSFNRALLYFTNTIPYSWILPRIYGVVHHGGSGTVHTALRYGCASLAVPHVLDQFIWNKIIYDKRLGPRGIKISKLTGKKVEKLILDLYQNEEYKRNAERMSLRMAEESSEDELCRFIERQPYEGNIYESSKPNQEK